VYCRQPYATLAQTDYVARVVKPIHPVYLIKYHGLVKCISRIEGGCVSGFGILVQEDHSLLACVDLVGDAIYSVVPLSLVAAVTPMVIRTVSKVIKSCL